MKKSFMTLIVSSFLLIFMTGCEKTYLSCSKTVTDNDDIKINETIKLGYKRKDLVNANIYHDYKFKNQNIDERTFRTSLETECEEYKNQKGVTCLVQDIDGGLHFELSLEVNKLSDSSKVTFEELLSYDSYMDSKSTLSKEYTCK